ncbi:MAG: WecB/TagA/CpsF family glycosyltransferase [Haloechinothrix sp.]
MTTVEQRHARAPEQRVEVLGVGVSVTSLPHAVDTVERWIECREQHYVCVSGVHGVMESQQDPELLAIHNASGLTVPDGAPLLWAGRYVGASGMGRVRGPDLLPAIAERAARKSWRIFLYGGAPGTPELLADKLTERYPGLVIAGTCAPPFRALTAAEQDEVVDRINAADADIVMVGLSTPKQERWMAWAMRKIKAPAMFGFGAAFDIHAGLVPEAPAWIRPTGFEWAYRLAKNPRRLARRYLRNNPRFVASVLRRPPRLLVAWDGTSAIDKEQAVNQSRKSELAGVRKGSAVKRAGYRVFKALERARVHVLPRHYYSPVADRQWLRNNEDLWRRPATVHGVDWNLDEQLAWLDKVCSTHLDEVKDFSFLPGLDLRGIGFRYGQVEAQVLHCAVRTFAPKRIVEIGSGASTAITSDAVARNVAEGRPVSAIVAIDPYMPQEIRALPFVEVRETPAQQVPVEAFADLSEGDLLFIDSTHVLKTGSELHRIYLELLPALPPGVLVHIHDIYLPYLYSPWALSDFWDWQETALLAALLTNNPKFEVLSCQSALHHAMPDQLQAVLPDYRPRPMIDGIDDGASNGHFPSSIWLRSRGGGAP